MKIALQKNDLRFRLKKMTGKGQSGQFEFGALVQHPMESGLRRDKKTGQIIPADYIESFMVFLDDKQVIEFEGSPFLYRNPLFAVMLRDPVKDGQRLRIVWRDNEKTLREYSSVIKLKKNGTYFYGKSFKDEARRAS